MKVFVICPSLDVPKYKGLAKISKELIEGLIKKGIDVEVYEVHGKTKTKWKYLKNLIPLKLLTKADVYHATTPECGTFLGLKKKSVVTVHDFIPYVLDIKFRDLALAYTTFMWGLAIKYCKTIIANSSLTADLIFRIYRRRAFIINPGVDEKFRELKTERKYIGFFANFSLRKGLDVCVQAYKKLIKIMPDAPMLSLNGGKLISVYQKQFNVEDLIKGIEDRVRIRNYIPDEEVVELYNSFKIFCFPSKIEGFGIPILEAQTCGVPVLILKNAIIPKEVREGCVECEDAEDMAWKIKELLEDESLYKEIARKGKEHAEKFSWENFIDKHVEIYESL